VEPFLLPHKYLPLYLLDRNQSDEFKKRAGRVI
jgi:hypothetical protein